MNDWFAQCQTLAEARELYRRLCFEHHPDHGGDTLIMQAINAAYERFKLQRAPHINRSPRSHWKRPARQRPDDIPWQSRHVEPEAEPQPVRSRDYFHSVWSHQSWQPIANGGVVRHVWSHSVALVHHPSPKYAGAWFVVLDGTVSPLVHETRAEAEEAAFDLLYEKVKYLDI